MNRRSTISMFIFSLSFLVIGLVFLMNSSPAQAEKDQCYDAVVELYTRCDQVLAFGQSELASASDAISFCRNQDDIFTRACWTQCALDNPDCGVMADCIDTCFEGTTACGFTMEFIYNTCDLRLRRPDTNERLNKVTARSLCSTAGESLQDYFECLSVCAYDYWRDCTEMDSCTQDCAEDIVLNDDTGDDDAGDDDTGEMSEDPADAGGEGLDDEGGSACGF